MKKQAITGATLLVAALLSGCGGSGGGTASTPPSATATPTPVETVTVTATPTPSSIATSGNYGADLAALGVVPDTVQGFADHMKEQICDQTGTSLGVAVRSIGGNESGGGIDGVRLTVAYFCPEKSQEVESYLEYFNQ
ncbi:hypothetical protein [Arthrobacter sp. ISL-28]|uniref:hypothetical protein n=1 Tax=Arthrobacter sp. ISL-28 TaxID=2819108 RepID=UPI001BEB06DE|nr:hypothetical protein [Arthrobacter sp. ISL-28]MBT2523273.1 hypothetical protein [Arthrobacter sp. ISL-28]